MPNTFIISDTHFGHANIVDKFIPARPFSCIEEHDEFIIDKHNSIVGPKDRVYHAGDVAMSATYIKYIGRMNGKFVLIRGNHDIFGLQAYTKYFEDIRSYKVWPDHRAILSHIPIHMVSMERFKFNVHGHTHFFKLDDPHYINICVEHTDYGPIALDVILNRIKEIEKHV